LEQWPHQILKGGRRLLCANLADPTPTGATRGRGTAPGLSAEHGPLHATCGHSLAPAAAPSLLAEHKPPPAACGCGTALGLSAEHGLLCATRGRGLVAIATPGLSAGHGLLRVAHNRGLATATRLQWTCDRDSSKISYARQQYK